MALWCNFHCTAQCNFLHCAVQFFALLVNFKSRRKLLSIFIFLEKIREIWKNLLLCLLQSHAFGNLQHNEHACAARGQAGVGDGHAGQPCGLPTCPRPPTPLTTGVRPSGLTRFACRCACRRFSSFLQIRKRDPSPLPNRCGGARGRVQRPQGGRQPPGVGGRHAPRRGGPLGAGRDALGAFFAPLRGARSVVFWLSGRGVRGTKVTPIHRYRRRRKKV